MSLLGWAYVGYGWTGWSVDEVNLWGTAVMKGGMHCCLLATPVQHIRSLVPVVLVPARSQIHLHNCHSASNASPLIPPSFEPCVRLDWIRFGFSRYRPWSRPQ